MDALMPETADLLRAIDVAAERWPSWSLTFIDQDSDDQERINTQQQHVWINLHASQSEPLPAALHAFAHVELLHDTTAGAFTRDEEIEADHLAELMSDFNADDFYPS